MNSAASSNFLLGVLLGFSMESLFGMVRQLTYFVLIGMVAVPYPGNLLEFYKLILGLSELDLLQGPTWYEMIFTFHESSPFSENFDEFGAGDMNFFMNSGSIPLIVLILLSIFLFKSAVLRLTLKYAHHPKMR